MNTPIGTPVHFKDALSEFDAVTRSMPWQIGNGEWVVALEGHTGVIALAIAPLAACDTTKVTQTFGEVVIHTAPAPTVKPEIGTPVSFERSPVVHYDGCLELTLNNSACPQQALHFDPAPEIGEPMTIVNEWPRTVTPLPDSCQLVTRQGGDYLRSRWENAAQQPCTPCVEHAQEVPETGCAKVVVP